MTIEAELRAALAALLRARDALRAAPDIPAREVVTRELAAAQTSIGRALHLLAGALTEPHA